VRHRGTGLYRGLPSPFPAGRYHSLVVERRTLPRSLRVTAWTARGEIMGLRHRRLDVEGVQFHPESVLTGEGRRLLGNWLGRLPGGRRPGVHRPAPAAGARR
jgi:anthranilate synthase component 2